MFKTSFEDRTIAIENKNHFFVDLLRHKGLISYLGNTWLSNASMSKVWILRGGLLI